MKPITLCLKRLGKKKIKTVEIEVDRYPETLEQLVRVCVESEVNTYNDKRSSVSLTNFLTPEGIQTQSETGKISFGDIENRTLANLKEAQENALLAFKDGLFIVFINEEEITELSTPVSLKDATITFLRMTFLTGTHW